MIEELKYSIDIKINRMLTETRKNKLMLALGNAAKEVLGEPTSGVVTIYSEKIEGYVIECQSHGFLAELLYWYKKPIEKAWVHPKQILEYLKERYYRWEFKPTQVYPASYDMETRTTKITGKPIDFYAYCMKDEED